MITAQPFFAQGQGLPIQRFGAIVVAHVLEQAGVVVQNPRIRYGQIAGPLAQTGARRLKERIRPGVIPFEVRHGAQMGKTGGQLGAFSG